MHCSSKKKGQRESEQSLAAAAINSQTQKTFSLQNHPDQTQKKIKKRWTSHELESVTTNTQNSNLPTTTHFSQNGAKTEPFGRRISSQASKEEGAGRRTEVVITSLVFFFQVFFSNFKARSSPNLSPLFKNNFKNVLRRRRGVGISKKIKKNLKISSDAAAHRPTTASERFPTTPFFLSPASFFGERRELLSLLLRLLC